MRAEVGAWCRKEALFSAGDRVICAVSGGADSMAMLWCLLTLREALGITVSAAHFNHRLRGAESDRDEEFVRSFCAAHGVALTVGSADVAARAAAQGESVETAARALRYAFLDGLTCDKVATAHNADDNAETVLLHLLRGSGLRGLCGIPPVRGRIVRPLLCVTRGQIEAFLRAEGVPWMEDSTNTEDTCRRNRLRHRVLPQLRAETPELSRRLTAQSEVLRAEDELLDALAARCLTPVGNGYLCAPVLAAPVALQRRALRLIARESLSSDVSLAHIEAMRALLTADCPSAQCSLPGCWLARRRYDALELVRPETAEFSPVPLQVPGVTELPVPGLRIHCEILENFQKITNTPFQFAIKYDMISAYRLVVRPRHAGDRITLPGGCTKTLKKLFIERKLPRAERGLAAVFAAGEAVLAVAGVGVSLPYAASPGDTVLRIQLEKTERKGAALCCKTSNAF